MNICKKRFVRRFHAAAVAIAMLLPTILSFRMFMGDDHIVYAAESETMGTDSYLVDKVEGSTIAVGKTYVLGSNAKTGGSATPHAYVLAKSGNKALMQSNGLWGGGWPGTGELSSAAAAYFGDLKNAISDVYLPIEYSRNSAMVYWNGKQTSEYAYTVHSILTGAANNYSAFGALRSYAWLAIPNGGVGAKYAYYVEKDGSIGYNIGVGDSLVCAPAFTIDTSKVSLSGDTLVYGLFMDSTGITATQSITSIEEGASVDLNEVITDVRYNDGDNAGRSASYTVAISTDGGSINGTTWTAPTGIHSDQTVELVIKDTVKNLTTIKNVIVTPRTARSIAVEKLSGFPETVTVGDTIDLSSYIKVTGYDSASESDGEITNYTLSVNPMYGTTEGTSYTPENVSSTKDISLTVTVGTFGTVDYSETGAAFTVRVKPDATGWTDRDAGTDELGFHSYTDPFTEITWKYRYNDNGFILYLYTEDDVAGIISEGRALLVPSSINGVPVVGIGGGSKDSQVIPFIPCEGDKVNDTWTSIYIPGSVKMIHDGAFYKNGASADIVIPGNISEIGVGAFKKSKIKSVTFNDADSLILNTESFANIPTLARAVIRGHGVTMKLRAFSHDTGLTQLDIPNGTKFKGAKDQNDSYVFEGTTGLELIKIDTNEVPSNVFSGNKNLNKVIFGENVSRVNYDWSGTAASNSETLEDTVARQTYALNADTIFEMDKTSGGSSFGYANELKVVGKNRSLDSDHASYNNMTDPVTAKIAYLAHYYTTNYEVRNYAKGTGSEIVITAEGEPADHAEVTSTIPDSQTGIEAYYKGAIFNGKNLDKNKTVVYKMYGDKQMGTYETAEFYVIRTTDADALLTAEQVSRKNGEKDQEGNDVYVTAYADHVLTSFEEKDEVTITDSDISTGTVDVKMIVLLKDQEGNILVDHVSGHVIAYSCGVSIPVREYSAENDFFENYGSYSTVISKIDDLSDQVTKLKQTVADRDSEIAHLTEEKDQLQGQYDELAQTQSGNQEIAASLAAQLAEKSQALEDATKKLADCREQLATHIAAYNALISELKKYMSETDMDESGYFGTIVNADDESGSAAVRQVVYIDGEPYDYEKTNQVFAIDGKDYPVYAGTGDLDHDGAEEAFRFLVTKDGVTILVEAADPYNPDQTVYTPGDTYTDTVGAIQRKAAAKLAAVSAELETVKGQITDLEGQLAELREQIRTLHIRISELETENEQLKQENEQLKQEKEALKKELDALKTANAKTLQEEKAKAEELKKKLEEQENAAKAAQKILENQNALTEKKLTAARMQVASLNANISALQRTNSGLQKQLAGTQPAAEPSSDHTEAAPTDGTASTDTKSRAINASNSKLSAENKTLSTSLKAAQKSLAAAQSQVDALSSENASLRSQMSGLNARPSSTGVENSTRPVRTTDAMPAPAAVTAPQKQASGEKPDQIQTNIRIVLIIILAAGSAAAVLVIRAKTRKRKLGITIGLL